MHGCLMQTGNVCSTPSIINVHTDLQDTMHGVGHHIGDDGDDDDDDDADDDDDDDG